MRTFFGIVLALTAMPVFVIIAIAGGPPHCGDYCTLSEVSVSVYLVSGSYAALVYLSGMALIADVPDGLTGPDPYVDIEAMHRRIEMDDDE